MKYLWLFMAFASVGWTLPGKHTIVAFCCFVLYEEFKAH